MTKNSSRRWGGQVVLYGLLALALLWTLVPIAWMVLSSFKSPDDLLSTTPKVIFEPTFQHYQGLFMGANSLWGYVQNSLLAAIAAVIVPLYLIFRNLALLDSVVGLIIAYLTFNLPFAIWLMNAFFADLPPSLEEAAMVDGATRFQAFWRVALPLVTPGIVTTAILCLIFSWNDYVFARTFSGPESQTIPIAAAQLITQTGIDWGKLTAIGTVVVLPMILVGLAVRRWLVRGLTLGAVKGE